MREMHLGTENVNLCKSQPGLAIAPASDFSYFSELKRQESVIAIAHPPFLDNLGGLAGSGGCPILDVEGGFGRNSRSGVRIEHQMALGREIRPSF
jgi:hypothetical protein